MSTSRHRLTLRTNNSQAEILLVDGSFRVLARGPSPLTHEVPPGLYAMKVKVGDQENEKLLAVESNSTALELTIPAPEFESPIPLSKTATARKRHQALVARLMAPDQATLSLGKGSMVTVCVRDPSLASAAHDFLPTKEDSKSYSASFKGFSIWDRDGVCLVDLDQMADRDMRDGYMAIGVELSPGSYSLAYRRQGSWTCLPLPAASGWALQVFVNVVPTGHTRFNLTPDLGGLAVAFGRIGSGFSSERAEWLVAETLRQGQLEGRNYVNTPEMERIRRAEFEDPMLGLYGAYLLLGQSEPNHLQIQTVAEKLESLLGITHPDVVALAAAIERKAGQTDRVKYSESLANRIRTLAGPPMLMQSWDALIHVADRTEGLANTVPRVFGVARDLVPNGSFVAWQRKLGSVTARSASDIEPFQERRLAVTSAAAIEISPEVTANRTATGRWATASKLIGAVGSAAKPWLQAGWNLLKNLRRDGTRIGDGDLAAKIAAIDTYEKAADAIVQLGQQHDWRSIVPNLRKNDEFRLRASGLHVDVLILLRDVASDDEALNSINAEFVAELLLTHRVPLSALADTLSDIELGGWLGMSIHQLAVQATKRRTSQPAAARMS